MKRNLQEDQTWSLLARLEQLNDHLQSVGWRLKDAIAAAIGNAVNRACRDLVLGLLGVPAGGNPDGSELEAGDLDDWFDAQDPQGEHDRPSRSRTSQRRCLRYSDAVRAALQTGLWWLRRQPGKHPLLTTTLVTLAAGGVALIAGPSLAACVSVVVSIASLLLTAESARTLASLFGSV